MFRRSNRTPCDVDMDRSASDVDMDRPASDAVRYLNSVFLVYFPIGMRLRGQEVKTSPFHGGNTGSIPVGVMFLALCNRSQQRLLREQTAQKQRIAFGDTNTSSSLRCGILASLGFEKSSAKSYMVP